MAKKPPDGFPLADAVESAERKFCQLRQLVEGVAQGSLRHLLVVGPQGVGKTHTIEGALRGPIGRKAGISVRKVAGHIAPLAAYQTLYNHRRPRDVLVFDDCDSAFQDAKCANLLKAATDSRPDRVVSWESSSRLVEKTNFVYDGRIIITTNHKPKGRVAESLVDRLMIFRLDLSLEERTARIVTVLNNSYRNHEKYGPVLDPVLGFLIRYHSRLGEALTLRTAIKALELASYSPEWEPLAEQVILET